MRNRCRASLLLSGTRYNQTVHIREPATDQNKKREVCITVRLPLNMWRQCVTVQKFWCKNIYIKPDLILCIIGVSIWSCFLATMCICIVLFICLLVLLLVFWNSSSSLQSSTSTFTWCRNTKWVQSILFLHWRDPDTALSGIFLSASLIDSTERSDFPSEPSSSWPHSSSLSGL